jgi:Mg/Co/Ni transporter MgtE
MNWDDFWAWFNQATDEVKEYLLVQVDLQNLIPTLSSKWRIQVLESAPRQVTEQFLSMLDDETLRSLGYGKPKQPNMMKYLTQ